MKKLVFLFTAFILTFSNLAYAETETVQRFSLSADLPTIAVFIDLDPAGVGEYEKSLNLIFEEVKKELLETKKVSIVDFDKTNKILRKYIRENSNAESTRERDLGFAPKENDFKELAKMADADYILYINTRITDRQVKNVAWQGTKIQNTVLVDMILTDKNVTEYIIDKTFTDSARSTGNSDKAFNRALSKALEQVDFKKINFVKDEEIEEQILFID